MIKPSTDDLEASYHNSSIISLDQTGIFPQDVNRTENCYAFINFDPEDEIARALGYSSGFSISVLLQIKEDGDVSVIIPSTSGFVLWVIRENNLRFVIIIDYRWESILERSPIGFCRKF